MFVHRDTAPIVRDGHRSTILVQRNRDLAGMPVHGLVDRVVEYLPNQVVQARRVYTTDVHGWTFANGL